MKNIRIITGVLGVLILYGNLLAENEVKVQVKKIQLSQGTHVRQFVARRPSGWIPSPRFIERVREPAPRPIRIRLDEIRQDNSNQVPPLLEQGTRVQRRNSEIWVARTERVFGNRSRRALAPLDLLPLGCVGCSDPVLSVVNATFEPITLYTYESLGPALATLTLLPGESAEIVLSYPGDWGVMIYGENTESWIFDSGLVYFPCNDRETWAITDPFAALDVVNYLPWELLLCVNDFYCDEPVGRIPYIMPLGTAFEFYFYPGTYRITLQAVVWPSPIYYDDFLNLLANEVTVLEVY